MPARAAASTDTGIAAFAPIDHDVEQQPERHQGYAGQPRVADEEQADQHRGEHQRGAAGEAGAGHQCRRTQLDDRGRHQQPDRPDAHLRQP